MNHDNSLSNFYAIRTHESFAQFVKEHAGLIRHWVNGRLPSNLAGRWEAVEDLTQEILLKIFQTAGKSKQWDHTRSKVETWMRTITFRHCASFLRRKGQKATLSCDMGTKTDSEGEKLDFDASVEDNRFERPDRAFRKAETLAALRQSIGWLREPYARILKLRYFEGLTLDQIAAQVGLTKATVFRRLKQAERKLLDNMGDLGLGA